MSQSEMQKKIYEKYGSGWHLPVNVLTLSDEGIFVFDQPPPPSRHCCSCFGLMLHVSLVPEGNDTICSIWAEVGHMPYTAESGKGRADTIEILRATRHLPNVRFYVEQGQRMFSIYESRASGHHTLDSLMIEILCFAQEALPFVNLLRERAG